MAGRLAPASKVAGGHTLPLEKSGSDDKGKTECKQKQKLDGNLSLTIVYRNCLQKQTNRSKTSRGGQPERNILTKLRTNRDGKNQDIIDVRLLELLTEKFADGRLLLQMVTSVLT
jgi:hypothetical protein